MKEDKALILKWLCSALPCLPPDLRSKETNSQTNGVLNQHPPRLPQCLTRLIEELAQASPPPLSHIPPIYWALTGDPLYKNIHIQSYSSWGRKHKVLVLHIVLTDRQPRTGKAANTNILITHRREGFRRGLVQVLLSVSLLKQIYL